MSIFYFIAFLSILFAVLVISAKNPVHSILYLVLTFFTFTIQYILLNAQFLAIVNFIVYMGAILVLFLYTLMLINLNKDSEPMKTNLVKIAVKLVPVDTPVVPDMLSFKLPLNGQ